MKQLMFTCVLGSILVLAVLSGCGEETVHGPSIDQSSNATLTAGTLTFWMLPEWAGNNVDSQFQILHFGAINTWANRLDIFKDYAYLRLLISPDSGIESGISMDIRSWKKGDRHMITATWGDGVAALYIDALLVGTVQYDSELNLGPFPPLFISSGNPTFTGGRNSDITNLQIYSRVLSVDEIAMLFAQPPG